jgi:hypothetical protein
VFVLMDRMRGVCRHVTVIETRVHSYAKARRMYKGRSYWGVVGIEPDAGTSALSREALWSSIGNPRSFELTRSSLCNAPSDAGYSSVVECHVPPYLTEEPRGTFVAFARPTELILVSPPVNERVADRLHQPPTPLSVVLLRHPVYRFVRDLVPTPARRSLKRMASHFRRTVIGHRSTGGQPSVR